MRLRFWEDRKLSDSRGASIDRAFITLNADYARKEWWNTFWAKAMLYAVLTVLGLYILFLASKLAILVIFLAMLLWR